MEFRPLDITVISARDLKDVNLISKMDVYVVATVSTDPNAKRKKTPVDKDGGRSPKWNHRMNFSVDESAIAHQPNLSLVFKIKSERPLGDKDIGEVAVPIKEMLDNNAAGSGGIEKDSERVVEYQVRTASGKSKGTLKFSYKLGEKFTEQIDINKSKDIDEPVTAYPAQAGGNTAYPPGVPYSYALPHPGMAGQYAHPPGYGFPPPPGYGGGYPHAAAAPAYGYPNPGYGYPPAAMQQKPQKAKAKKGSKLGLGIGAGLLGGLLVGDMISDVGEMAAFDF